MSNQDSLFGADESEALVELPSDFSKIVINLGTKKPLAGIVFDPLAGESAVEQGGAPEFCDGEAVVVCAIEPELAHALAEQIEQASTLYMRGDLKADGEPGPVLRAVKFLDSEAGSKLLAALMAGAIS